jgi:hypothetical protein
MESLISFSVKLKLLQQIRNSFDSSDTKDAALTRIQLTRILLKIDVDDGSSLHPSLKPRASRICCCTPRQVL